MKRLVVMRHAKSDWDAGASTDHERPLNDRGKKEAPLVGAKLAAAGFAPQVVTSSDARRTTETLELARSAWPGARIVMTPDFYHAGLPAVRAAARELDADVTTWLVLGHNPGWEEMIDQLTGEEIQLKTSYAAVLESNGASFVDALRGASMKLVDVIKP